MSKEIDKRDEMLCELGSQIEKLREMSVSLDDAHSKLISVVKDPNVVADLERHMDKIQSKIGEAIEFTNEARGRIE